MKRFSLVMALVLLILAESFCEDGFITLPEGLEFPLCAGTTDFHDDHQIRDFDFYSICYRETYEQAEWSAYRLTREQLVKNASRSDDFRPDPEIKTGSAALSDYKGSGYDRGHLSPAADFSFSEKAMSDTFYLSNMSPQTAGLNRGLWKDLEAKVRNWADRYGRIYVISGPVLNKAASEFPSIGKNQVAVPEAYYKILLVPVYLDKEDMESPDTAFSLETIAFIMQNQKLSGSIFDYATSVREIEAMTNLNFFDKLNEEIQDKIETEYHLEVWD